MAVSWLILEILTLFFYKNLPEFIEPAQTDEASETTPIAINNTTYSSISGHGEENTSEEEIETVEKAQSSSSPLIKNKVNVNSSNGYEPIRVIDNAEAGHFIVRMYNEYIRDEMVAVFATTFMVFFMQTCLEVRIT